MPSGTAAIRVLWIDDEPSVIDSSRGLFARAGIQVQPAVDAASGLRLAGTYAPDIIILDQRLAHELGTNLLAELRRAGFDTPVMVYTAYADSLVGFAAGRAGATTFYQKPMAGQALLDAIYRTITIGRGTAEAAEPTAERVRRDAYARWARAIMAVVKSQPDITTLGDWAMLLGWNPATLRNRWRGCGLSPRGSLMLARALRARRLSLRCSEPPEHFLSIDDYRTLRRFQKLAQFGLLTQDDWLFRQRIIVNEAALTELSRVIFGAREGQKM